MLDDLTILKEPELIFRYGQRAIDPRAGLSLFGPYDADLPSHKRSLPYAVVGTPEGIADFLKFVGAVRGPIVSPTGAKSPTLWPAFPGFDTAFCSELPATASRTVELDSVALTTTANLPDPNQRAYGVVDQYLKAIEAMAGTESPFEAVICVVPEIVYANCRSKSHVRSEAGEVRTKAQLRAQRDQRRARSLGIRDITNLEASIEPYRFSPDFRRQIKARAMKFDPPIQIIRESTLRLSEEYEPGQRLLTPLSDRAWNIGTTLYYKGGGRPWKLVTSRDGVCYVGVVFHRAVGGADDRFAACAAQMFLDDGDGVVLRGESGPWYSRATRTFHLSAAAAEALLTKVLKEYGEGSGKPLQEIFLHYRAGINAEEFEGFRKACPAGVRLVAVKVRTQRDDVRLYREGSRPVIRGSLLKAGRAGAYLWGSGFKPWLRTYDGVEVPAPMEIRIQHGVADIVQVSIDILGLTKLNYNECRLGDAQPVTIGFSEAVGEILVSNPGAKHARSRFKYYV
jgi:hypothetical protein